MKFGSISMANLKLSPNMCFLPAFILKMARKTIYAMGIQPETSFVLKSIIKAIKKIGFGG
jgi:hypothetical protein